MPGYGKDERILICVESAQDTDRLIRFFRTLKIEGVSCADYMGLTDQINQGAAAIILSGLPSLLDRSSPPLSVLYSQPAWSALPIIFITEQSYNVTPRFQDLPLGVIFMERPVRIKTLLSVTKMALNLRHNQYMVRDLLYERETLVNRLSAEAKMKNEFLATLAHELRNPLAPIRTGLQIIRLSPAEKPATQILDMMDRQVCHLVRLIDDLLDISRITCGKLVVRKQMVSLSSLISDAVETSRSVMEEGKHTLSVSTPDEPIMLEVDPTRITQVISNLLNNAARYTPSGGYITLRARPQKNTIQIEVTDNGMGISPDMLTKVFNMFTQVESSIVQSKSGLGLGLTLARRLAEMHDGTIEASSPGPGKGSTFTVTLPYGKMNPSTSADENIHRV